MRVGELVEAGRRGDAVVMAGGSERAFEACRDVLAGGHVPWPGELGQRIYDNVSAQAWKMWEDRQKMILNEYRLMPWQKEGQELVRKHLEDFFFGETAAPPPGYVPNPTK